MKIYFFFGKYKKNISSHMLKISQTSLVLRTRELTDIFITFDGIYLVFISKKVNILYLIQFSMDHLELMRISCGHLGDVHVGF